MFHEKKVIAFKRKQNWDSILYTDGYFCHKYIRGLQIGRNNTRYQWVGIHYLFESVEVLEFMIQEQDLEWDQVCLPMH